MAGRDPGHERGTDAGEALRAGYLAASLRVEAPFFNRAAASRATAVPSKKRGFGAPYGLSYSLSQGVISARWAPDTVTKAFPPAEFFQIDAVINTGNSGGPMFNRAGEVIGIVSHNISKSGGSEGLGFAVTANSVKSLLVERNRRFWGFDAMLVAGEMAQALKVPKSGGFLVKQVAKDSVAERLGLTITATRAGGNLAATALASSMSLASMTKNPLSCSFVSIKGPTVSRPCRRGRGWSGPCQSAGERIVGDRKPPVGHRPAPAGQRRRAGSGPRRRAASATAGPASSRSTARPRTSRGAASPTRPPPFAPPR